MNKKFLCVMISALFCFGLSACSLALPEVKNGMLDQLCGVWVVVEEDNSKEIDPNGFKEEDAIVWTNILIKDDEFGDYVDGEKSGGVTETTVNVHATNEGTVNNYEGSVYFNVMSEMMYTKLIPLYQKDDGTIYADKGGIWSGFNGNGEFGSETVEHTYTTTLNGKATQEKSQYKIHYKSMPSITELKLVYMSGDMRILKEEILDLDSAKQKESWTANAPAQCEMVLAVEKTAEKDGTAKRQYTLYSASDMDDENWVEHPCILPGKSFVAQMVPIRIQMPK